jgi:hypothetical protein
VFIVVSVYFVMTRSGNFWIHPRMSVHPHALFLKQLISSKFGIGAFTCLCNDALPTAAVGKWEHDFEGWIGRNFGGGGYGISWSTYSLYSCLDRMIIWLFNGGVSSCRGYISWNEMGRWS